MFVTGLTEYFFRKKFCDSQASKMKKKWVYKNCVTENFFSIFIFFSETLNGHVRQKNEVYKNDCDWALLGPFSVKSFVTLNGHNQQKNEVYKKKLLKTPIFSNFCDENVKKCEKIAQNVNFFIFVQIKKKIYKKMIKK